MPSRQVLNFHILPAGYGDCAVIEYGEDDARKLVVVDGGLAPTSKLLKRFLNDRPDCEVELLVVSHIDSDHIAGAKALLKTGKVAARFKDIWFNGLKPPAAKAALEGLGFKQGDALSEILGTELPHNESFGRQDVAVEGKALPVKDLPGGARLIILSPSREGLQELRTAWSEWKQDQASEPDSPHSTKTAAHKGLQAMGGETNLDEGMVDALSSEQSSDDSSLANGSSIAFVFEFQGVRILMAADAHVTQLLDSSSRIPGGVPCMVDVFKLSHHGSERNVSHDLLRAFPSKRYVVSTDATRHGHPNDIALARVVRSSPGCELIFNYPHASATRWKTYGLHSQTGLTVTAPGKSGDAIGISLL